MVSYPENSIDPLKRVRGQTLGRMEPPPPPPHPYKTLLSTPEDRVYDKQQTPICTKFSLYLMVTVHDLCASQVYP